MSFVYIEIIHGFNKGKLFYITDGANSLGRNESNTIVFDSQEKSVSNHHAIIYKSPGQIYFQDLKSTNGSYVNDTRTSETLLNHQDILNLGKRGPRLQIVISETELTMLQSDPETSSLPATDLPVFSKNITSPNLKMKNLNYHQTDNNLTSDRSNCFFNPNKFNVFPFYNSINKYKIQISIISFFLILLLLILFLPLNIFVKNDFENTDRKVHFSKAFSFTKLKVNSLMSENSDSDSLNFLLEDQIRNILTKFGENDAYIIPENMIERVNYYIGIFSGRMKTIIDSYIKKKDNYFPLIQKILKEKNLPEELAYISMLESGFNPYAKSKAGAYGIWQFMPHTARRYGLIVNDSIDQRTDPEKSSYAAAAYFNELIALYGGKSSVMLAMAAYNAGEGKVNNALRKIEDPLKNRDFWYIYRKGYLTTETNEYIPKVIALIIICENKSFKFLR